MMNQAKEDEENVHPVGKDTDDLIEKHFGGRSEFWAALRFLEASNQTSTQNSVSSGRKIRLQRNCHGNRRSQADLRSTTGKPTNDLSNGGDDDDDNGNNNNNNNRNNNIYEAGIGDKWKRGNITYAPARVTDHASNHEHAPTRSTPLPIADAGLIETQEQEAPPKSNSKCCMACKKSKCKKSKCCKCCKCCRKELPPSEDLHPAPPDSLLLLDQFQPGNTLPSDRSVSVIGESKHTSLYEPLKVENSGSLVDQTEAGQIEGEEKEAPEVEEEVEEEEEIDRVGAMEHLKIQCFEELYDRLYDDLTRDLYHDLMEDFTGKGQSRHRTSAQIKVKLMDEGKKRTGIASLKQSLADRRAASNYATMNAVIGQRQSNANRAP